MCIRDGRRDPRRVGGGGGPLVGRPHPPKAGTLGSTRRRRLGNDIGLRVAVTVGVTSALSAVVVLVAVVFATQEGTTPTLEDRLLWSAAGVALAAVVITAAAGWFATRSLVRPLDDIVAATRRAATSMPSECGGPRRPGDALSRLASTVDGLLDRVEATVEAQRRFVAFASNELRVPLAAQRAALELRQDDPALEPLAATRDRLLEITRRGEHLVESLIVLAEADRGLSGGTRSRLAVETLVDEASAGVADAARASSLHVVVDHGSFGVVDGDAALVGRLVRNLVVNAVEYNEPGGWVRVGATADAVVVVENSGPVVDDEAAATVTRPFVRIAPAATSAPTSPGGAVPASHSGLGLAIVASIARAHGWAVEVVPRDGGGLRVSVG